MIGASACPYCEATPADRAEHLATFHRDRLVAAVAYQRAIEAGRSTVEAQAAYNESLRGPRPGIYDRSAFRRAS